MFMAVPGLQQTEQSLVLELNMVTGQTSSFLQSDLSVLSVTLFYSQVHLTQNKTR